MEIREKIANKILKNDGKILHKYTVEKYAQKYFTNEEYKYIYSVDGKTITERLWKIVNGVDETPKCPVCRKALPFMRGWNGYQTYCSNHCTCLGRSLDQKAVKAKRDKTNLSKYGQTGYINCHTKEANDKRNKTSIEKYGKSPDALAREGIDSKKRIDAVRKSYIENKHEIQKKKDATCIKKYGCKLGQRDIDRQRMAENFNKKTFYIYEGEKFGSSQELYFWIYCKDCGIRIQRNKRGFKYEDEKGKQQHMFFPGFYLVDTKELVEIKGSHLRDTYKWKQKEKVCKENGIKVYYTDSEDCKKFRDFVWSHYGKDYIKQFKIKQQKRNVVYIDENTDLFEKRNDNVKYMFICQNCGKEVVTSYKTVKCAGLLCKQCRKK